MSLRLVLVLLVGIGLLPAVAAAQPVSVQANVVGAASISRYEPLVLTLSRPLEPAEGRLAVFIGTTDLTALFSSFGGTWRYEPGPVPLPTGAHDLIVYLVAPDGAWQELARWLLRVRLPGGFERVAFDPGLSLSNKGQVAEGRFPEPLQEPPRRTYQDFSGQFNGWLHLERQGWLVEAQGGVVGASYQNEALRFGTLQEDAPQIDLSQYLLHVRRGAVGVQVGHVAYGRHPYLISGFGSRGTVAEADLGRQVDVSLAVMNGSSVVGWANPLGLNEPDHRIFSGSVGLELLEARPGAFRVEASYLDGSVLPFTGFNQGAVVDAERSQGGGARVLASTRSQRFRFEGGVAGSRFTNPPDPTLAQGAPLVPVDETTRFAYYADLSVGLLRNVQLAPAWPVAVSARLRRERVDPLYRSVASFVRPDVLQHTVEARGSLGAVQAQYAHNRSEDNLDGIASILKTHTRQHSVGLTVPVSSVAGATTGAARALLPTLSYQFNQTHQFGDDLPVEGGFNASHVPDQRSAQHNASIDWYGGIWRLGYRLGHAFQDNRQEGREDADFLNVTHSLSLGITPSRLLDVSVDLSHDRAESLADERIDRTRRLGVRTSLRPFPTLALTASLSPTRMQDDDRIRLRTSTNVQAEAAWSFNLGSGLRKLARGQLFVRYARFASRNQDRLFDLDTENRTWSVNTGASLTLF